MLKKKARFAGTGAAQKLIALKSHPWARAPPMSCAMVALKSGPGTDNRLVGVGEIRTGLLRKK
jgi:hypothetical protein